MQCTTQTLSGSGGNSARTRCSRSQPVLFVLQVDYSIMKPQRHVLVPPDPSARWEARLKSVVGRDRTPSRSRGRQYRTRGSVWRCLWSMWGDVRTIATTGEENVGIGVQRSIFRQYNTDTRFSSTTPFDNHYLCCTPTSQTGSTVAAKITPTDLSAMVCATKHTILWKRIELPIQSRNRSLHSPVPKVERPAEGTEAKLVPPFPEP